MVVAGIVTPQQTMEVLESLLAGLFLQAHHLPTSQHYPVLQFAPAAVVDWPGDD